MDDTRSLEPDFNDSIAAIANASSSCTNGSSDFSSERTLTNVVDDDDVVCCSFPVGEDNDADGGGIGGVRVGETSIEDFISTASVNTSSDRGGEDGCCCCCPLDLL